MEVVNVFEGKAEVICGGCGEDFIHPKATEEMTCPICEHSIATSEADWSYDEDLLEEYWLWFE